MALMVAIIIRYISQWWQVYDFLHSLATFITVVTLTHQRASACGELDTAHILAVRYRTVLSDNIIAS